MRSSRKSAEVLLALAFLAAFETGAGGARVRASYDETFSLAEKAYRDGLYDVAIDELKKLLEPGKEAGGLQAVHYLMGECMRRKGEIESALREYELVVRDGKDPMLRERAALRSAWVHYQRKDCDKLSDASQRLATVRPDSTFIPVCNFWVGECLLGQGKLAEADKAWSKLREDFPGFPGADYVELRRAFLLARMGKLEEALAVFEKAGASLTNDVTGAMGLHGKGLCLFGLGRLREARASFEEVLERHPESELARFALLGAAESCYRLKQYGTAKPYFDKLEKEFPGSAEAERASYMSGWVELRSERPADAAARFKKFLESFPESKLAGEAQFCLGAAARWAGDTEGARKAWAAFLQESPDTRWQPFGAVSLGCLELERGEAASAREAFTAARAAAGSPIAGIAKFGQAVSLWRLGDLKKAVEVLEEACEKLPDGEVRSKANLWAALGEFSLGKFEQAAKRLEEMAGGSGELEVLAHYWLAEALLAGGKNKEAIEQFRGVIGADSASLAEQAQYGLALAYRSAGEWKDAREAFDGLERRFRKGRLAPRAGIEVGDMLLAQGKASEAREAYVGVTRRYGDSELGPLALFSVGYSYYKEGDFAQASSAFGRVLEEFGDSELADDALLWNGWCRYRLGQFQEAIAGLRGLVQESPKSPLGAEALYSIAAMYTNEGMTDDARQSYADLIRSFPDSGRQSEAEFEIALTYEREGVPQKARSSMEALATRLAGQPVAARALVWVATYDYRSGDFKKAEAGFLQVLANYPGTASAVEAQYWLGRTYVALGKLDKAREELSRVVSSGGPNQGEARVALAETMLEEGNCEEAIATTKPLLAGDGVSRDTLRGAHFVMGSSLQTLGRWKEAIKEFEHVLGVEDDSGAEAQFRIGECRERLGELPEATVEYLKVVYFHAPRREWVLAAEEKAASCFEARGLVDEARNMYAKLAEADREGVQGNRAREALERLEKSKQEKRSEAIPSSGRWKLFR